MSAHALPCRSMESPPARMRGGRNAISETGYRSHIGIAKSHRDRHHCLVASTQREQDHKQPPEEHRVGRRLGNTAHELNVLANDARIRHLHHAGQSRGGAREPVALDVETVGQRSVQRAVGLLRSLSQLDTVEAIGSGLAITHSKPFSDRKLVVLSFNHPFRPRLVDRPRHYCNATIFLLKPASGAGTMVK